MSRLERAKVLQRATKRPPEQGRAVNSFLRNADRRFPLASGPVALAREKRVLLGLSGILSSRATSRDWHASDSLDGPGKPAFLGQCPFRLFTLTLTRGSI